MKGELVQGRWGVRTQLPKCPVMEAGLPSPLRLLAWSHSACMLGAIPGVDHRFFFLLGLWVFIRNGRQIPVFKPVSLNYVAYGDFLEMF